MISKLGILPIKIQDDQVLAKSIVYCNKTSNQSYFIPYEVTVADPNFLPTSSTLFRLQNEHILHLQGKLSRKQKEITYFQIYCQMKDISLLLFVKSFSIILIRVYEKKLLHANLRLTINNKVLPELNNQIHMKFVNLIDLLNWVGSDMLQHTPP